MWRWGLASNDGENSYPGAFESDAAVLCVAPCSPAEVPVPAPAPAPARAMSAMFEVESWEFGGCGGMERSFEDDAFQNQGASP